LGQRTPGTVGPNISSSSAGEHTLPVRGFDECHVMEPPICGRPSTAAQSSICPNRRRSWSGIRSRCFSAASLWCWPALKRMLRNSQVEGQHSLGASFGFSGSLSLAYLREFWKGSHFSKLNYQHFNASIAKKDLPIQRQPGGPVSLACQTNQTLPVRNRLHSRNPLGDRTFWT
jgi:hypothetical protein